MTRSDLRGKGFSLAPGESDYRPSWWEVTAVGGVKVEGVCRASLHLCEPGNRVVPLEMGPTISHNIPPPWATYRLQVAQPPPSMAVTTVWACGDISRLNHSTTSLWDIFSPQVDQMPHSENSEAFWSLMKVQGCSVLIDKSPKATAFSHPGAPGPQLVHTQIPRGPACSQSRPQDHSWLTAFSPCWEEELKKKSQTLSGQFQDPS